MNSTFIDGLTVVSANIFNLLAAAVFLARAGGFRHTEWLLGLFVVALGLPAALAVAANIIANRELWTILLPAFLFCYCALEFVLDYLLKLDFRKTRFLSVYLGVFYRASLAIIGYSFGVGREYGFLTLATYWAGLPAMWYSHSQVGHG